MFPPNGYSFPSSSVTQTIGRFSIISGNDLMERFNFSSWSFLIVLGLSGFCLNLLIGIISLFYFKVLLKYHLSLLGSDGSLTSMLNNGCSLIVCSMYC